jgi:putative transposase
VGGGYHICPDLGGFLYLAVVLDAFNRRIVGWSMATTLASRLVLDALNMALMTRRPRGVDITGST